MFPLTDKDFRKIISRRDARFDGRFYFGVRTTRIYCRPICPAKPKPENITIFRSSSEAERKGFRPCMRCRPDLAPGSNLLAGTANTVGRALRIIENLTGQDLKIETLASSLGVSDRHLRRLFEEYLGASPLEIVITQRLHFAKQLVQTTKIPVTEIAFASGFQSLRRFNEAFKERFQKSPTAIRKDKGIVDSSNSVLKIPLRLPYDWSTIVTYLARHACYGLEEVVGGSYVRFVSISGKIGIVRVSRFGSHAFLSVEFENIPLVEWRGILTRIRYLFDTDHNPFHLPKSENPSPEGIRVPGAFDPFETAVSIILSQVISTSHARAKLKSLVKQYGRILRTENGREIFSFPTAQVLSEAQIEEIGITKIKADAIRELSKSIIAETISFRAPCEFPELYEKLLSLRGIGTWTASLIMMRCMRDPDAFPLTDLVVAKMIEKKVCKPSKWSSSRSYLAHCLWRDYAEESSVVKKR